MRAPMLKIAAGQSPSCSPQGHDFHLEEPGRETRRGSPCVLGRVPCIVCAPTGRNLRPCLNWRRAGVFFPAALVHNNTNKATTLYATPFTAPALLTVNGDFPFSSALLCGADSPTHVGCPGHCLVATMTYTGSEGGGGWLEAKKKVCVPKIDLQFRAPLRNFTFLLRTHFLMWVGWVRRSPGCHPPPPPGNAKPCPRAVPSIKVLMSSGCCHVWQAHKQAWCPRQGWDQTRLHGAGQRDGMGEYTIPTLSSQAPLRWATRPPQTLCGAPQSGVMNHVLTSIHTHWWENRTNTTTVDLRGARKQHSIQLRQFQ